MPEARIPTTGFQDQYNYMVTITAGKPAIKNQINIREIVLFYVKVLQRRKSFLTTCFLGWHNMPCFLRVCVYYCGIFPKQFLCSEK